MLQYPAIRRGDTVDEFVSKSTPEGKEEHVRVADPYRWLEDHDSPETKEFVEVQNKLFQAHIKGCESRDLFAQKIEKCMTYERHFTPFREGNRIFFYHNEGLQNQNVLFYQDGLEGKPQILMDPNTLEADGTASLGSIAIDEQGEWLAYGVARSGSDWNTIYVKRVEPFVVPLPAAEEKKAPPELKEEKKQADVEEERVDVLQWIKFSSIAWTHDSKGFFYARYPAPASLAQEHDEAHSKRGTETEKASAQQVYYHVIGTKQKEDVLILATPQNPEWLFGVEVSDDGKYLLVSISKDCDAVNRLWVADLQSAPLNALCSAARPADVASLIQACFVWKKVADEFSHSLEYVTNEGSVLICTTNRSAPRNQLVAVSIEDSRPEAWQELVPEQADVLESVRAVNKDQLILTYMHDVVDQVFMLPLRLARAGSPAPAFDRSQLSLVLLPGLGTISGPSARKKDSDFFYSFTSFLQPPTIYRFDCAARASSTLKETRVPGLDPSTFETRQVFYASKDGTRIPMFLVAKKGVLDSRENKLPVLLYGYGGFNISLQPSFSPSRLLFIQHLGAVYAVPNIRGGGEYGISWYKQGVLAKKQNVFDDFQAAAKYLVEQGITTPAQIAILGGSNGGLLVGACLTQAPELFGCAVSQVGVLDLLRFHRFTIGYAWKSDYGCAEVPEEFPALFAYSPLHNVRLAGPDGKPHTFPSVLLLTASHDDRVSPLHSFKFIAELQHQLGQSQKNPLLIRVDVKAGHGGGKALAKVIAETADIYAFIANAIGAKWLD